MCRISVCCAHLKLSRIDSPEGKTIYLPGCAKSVCSTMSNTLVLSIELTRRFLEISISVRARWHDENISRRPNSPTRLFDVVSVQTMTMWSKPT